VRVEPPEAVPILSEKIVGVEDGIGAWRRDLTRDGSVASVQSVESVFPFD